MTYELQSDEDRILSMTDEQAARELDVVTILGLDAPRYSGETSLTEDEKRILGW